MKIKALLCALLLPCTLSAQSKGIDVPLHFVPENIPNHEHTWTPNYIHIIGNADKSKSEYISRLKDPKIMEVELIDNQKFQFAVGFDKQGNKWIVPYNFDKYQPYANIPFMFNEDCTNEIIYLRFPRYRQLKAYTLRRYYREEKDKSGKGKTSYGKMMFDGGWFGHHAGELNIANTHYGVKSWMTSLIISDSSGKVLVDRMLDYDPVIMLNKQKYFAEIFDKYKSPHLRLEPLTDSLLALNKALVPPADFSRMELTALADSKTTLLKNTVSGRAYTLVDFWGTWCGPCVAELPHLAEVYGEYGDKVNFISVAYNSENDKIKDLMQKNNITWQQFYLSKAQGKAQAEKYMLNSFPTFMLIDGKGQVVYRSDRDYDTTVVAHKDRLLKTLEKYIDNK